MDTEHEFTYDVNMVGGAAREDLEKLKQYLRAKAPRIEKRGAVIESGIESFDRLLEGGLPKGGITVFAGAPGSGRMTLAAKLLANETRKSRPVAWVDANATLYPPALDLAGVDLTRLLLVRGARDRAFYAVEQIAASGAFSLVVASGTDQWLNPARARRVQTASEGANVSTLFLLDPATAAQLTNKSTELRLTRRSGGIQVELTKHRTMMPGKKTTLTAI